MRSPYNRQDGIIIRPGRWVEIEGRGVGKFSGTWINPVLGLGCSLLHFREYADLHKKITLFAFEDEPGIIRCLETVQIVDGPLKCNGKIKRKRSVRGGVVIPFVART